MAHENLQKILWDNSVSLIANDSIMLLYIFWRVSWKFQVIVCRHAKDYDETKGFAKIAVHLKLIQFFLSKLLQQ